MPTIPFIRSFATLIICTPILFGAGGWTQPTESPAVAGIDLADLRNAGYRIEWMNQSSTPGLRLPTVTDRSLYVLDQEDYLTRYDLQSGKWLWSTPVGNKVFELRGITEFPEVGLLYVISDGATYVIEYATGNFPSRQSTDESDKSSSRHILPMEWVASTRAIKNGKYLVYGSKTGDTIWFDPSIGFVSERYTIGSSVHVTPTYVEGIRNSEGLLRQAIVIPAMDGNVVAVDVHQISQIWSLKLLAAVVTPVTYATDTKLTGNEKVPRTSVFIAGSDQYLRSVDLHTGKPRWKALLSSPLHDTPVIHKGSLYQRVDSVGLVCYEAFPSSISGNLKWTAEGVTGTVITTTKSGRLVCWDSDKHLLQIVEPRLGGIVSTLTIPTARELFSDKETNGSLYVITNDETIIQLAPRL